MAQACIRGNEWVPADAFGVNDTRDTIHPVIWEHLVANGQAESFKSKAPRCPACDCRVMSAECARQCDPEATKWDGLMRSATELPPRLNTTDGFAKIKLWEQTLNSTVLFDLSTSTQQVLERSGRESVSQKNGSVTIVCEESLNAKTAPLSVSQQLYRVMVEREPSLSIAGRHAKLVTARAVEDTERHLSVEFLQQLSTIDESMSAVGIDETTSGPVFTNVCLLYTSDAADE